MPRVNPLRTTANAANVAGRIAAERAAHGWSYDGLAKRMADTGFPIQSSAIFKIEKGDPPRRITVDELVGFARVFGTTVDDLLMPPALVEQQEARGLIKQMDETTELIGEALESLVSMYLKYFQLAATNDDLRRFVHDAWFSPESAGADDEMTTGRVGSFLDERGDEVAPEASAKLTALFVDLVRGVIDVAADVVDAEVAHSKSRSRSRKRKA